MNEKVIWDCLLEKIGNEFGVAAVMGNLMAESSLNPRCVTNLKKTGYPDVNHYILASDDGAHDFAHDGAAFGLVQWCYHTRKAGLLEYAKATGRSVGHLQMQLEYLVKEMSTSYKTVWNAVLNSMNVRETSDIVMLKYEKPAGTSEAARQKRADYALKFLNEFSKVLQKPEETKPKQKMVLATDNVRIRAGNGKKYGQVGSLKRGQSMVWVATVDGWHAVEMKDRVGWVSGDFSEVRS